MRALWLPVPYWMAKTSEPRNTATLLTLAWRKHYQETARIKYPGGRVQDAKNAEKWVQQQLLERHRDIKRNIKYWPGWTSLVASLSYIPLWLAGLDTVRCMTGRGEILSTKSGPTSGGATVVFDLPGAASSAPADSADIVTTATGFSGIPVEPSLQLESILWTHTLAQPDPQWILPLAYWAIATYSIWSRVGRAKDPALVQTPVSRFLEQFRRAFLALPTVLTVIVIYTGMPSAVVLFLIGSSAAQILQRPVIARLAGISGERISMMVTKLPQLKAVPKKGSR
jgi:hypothetical protein